MNYTDLEREIISGTAMRRYEIGSELQMQLAKLDYCMTRFMEQFGAKLDGDEEVDPKYTAFYKDTTDEYTKITRLQRIINAYSNTATHNLHPGYA